MGVGGTHLVFCDVIGDILIDDVAVGVALLMMLVAIMKGGTKSMERQR